MEDLRKECGLLERILWIFMTDVDDYWSGRSGDSFKYICWYLKILLDSGYKGLDNLGNEISIAKEAISHNDINLSNQIQSKEHVKV